MKCLIATGNAHKVEEIRRLLGDRFELLSLQEVDPVEEPEETGDSFLQNARIKSRYYCQATGLPALADDSGLEIDALDGRPGIHSSRFAGETTPHSEKIARILALLEHVPAERRTARFRCVASATFPDGSELSAEGSLEGVIASAPSGEGGFGYDPIVFIPQLGKTVAELTPDEKDRFSHRGVAFRKLLEKLAARNREL